MAPRRRDQARDDADKVVVHVRGVAECGRARGHDGRDELVRLHKARVLDVEAIGGDTCERAVVEDDNRVGVVHQPLRGEERVVRLHHNVRRLGEHRVRLDELLGEAVVQTLEEERAES